jgi:hypothetical protein
MPATYSINVGTPTEAFRKQNINSVLLDLPDNTQKLISPKDVRDAFLSAWATSAFKQTIGQANIEYLGIDSGDPSNRDIKQKIFIGKRNQGGLDVMNNSLLNNTNNDIYIYNTKPDSSATQSTKVVILAGTNSILHTNAPYIQSNSINSNTALDLNLVNPSLFSGPINVFSSTGRVAINGITFPTVAETSASASNGRILKYSGSYPNGVLRWAEPTVSIANIGTIGLPTNIYGSPSNVNGYSLEFVDNSIVPQTIGGVVQGSSFSAGSYNGQNWPLSEVIRKILYPYVPPALSLSITAGGVDYFSTGITSSALFSYSITRYSNIVSSYNISGTTYSGLSFSGSVGSQLNATFSSDIYGNTASTQNYVLSARDNPFLLSFSYSATASVRFVHPSFYGFSLTDIDFYTSTSTAGILRATQLGNYINSLNTSRIIVPYLGTSQSVSVPYVGSGYVYFVYPHSYPLLSKIKDPNGFIIHDSNNLTYSAFTYSGSVTPTGGNNLAIPTPQWRVYKTIGTCSYTGSGEFEFIF